MVRSARALWRGNGAWRRVHGRSGVGVVHAAERTSALAHGVELRRRRQCREAA